MIDEFYVGHDENGEADKRENAISSEQFLSRNLKIPFFVINMRSHTRRDDIDSYVSDKLNEKK